MIEATYANPGLVAAWVEPESRSASGRGALNWRLTWSSGQGPALSPIVVLTALPRMTP